MGKEQCLSHRHTLKMKIVHVLSAAPKKDSHRGFRDTPLPHTYLHMRMHTHRASCHTALSHTHTLIHMLLSHTHTTFSHIHAFSLTYSHNILSHAYSHAHTYWPTHSHTLFSHKYSHPCTHSCLSHTHLHSIHSHTLTYTLTHICIHTHTCLSRFHSLQRGHGYTWS